MKRAERKQQGVRLRQYEHLTGAGVASPLALAVTHADAQAVGRKRPEPGDAADLMSDFPSLRRRLAGMSETDQALLAGAAAEVLDDPLAVSGPKSLAIASFGVTCAVLVVFALWVFPTFKDLFDSFGAALPLPTLAAVFLGQWVLLPLGVLVLVVLLADQLAVHLPGSASRWLWQIEAFKERLPGVRRQRQVVASRLLAGWLAATRGRMDPRDALEDCQALLGPNRLAMRLARVHAAMGQGTPLARALSQEGVCLPGLCLLLEDAAVDAQALAAYARSLDARADASTARQLLFAQLALGLVLGFFVIAMYLPIFKMGSVI